MMQRREAYIYFGVVKETKKEVLLWRPDTDNLFWVPKYLWREVEKLDTPLMKAVLMEWLEKEFGGKNE